MRTVEKMAKEFASQYIREKDQMACINGFIAGFRTARFMVMNLPISEIDMLGDDEEMENQSGAV